MLLGKGRRVALLVLFLSLTAWTITTVAGKKSVPWKGSLSGQGDFVEFVLDEDEAVIGRLDEDTIVGKSTHLGRFTVTPGADENGDPTSFHTFNFLTGEAVGQAVWRAANGDELFVSYQGFGVPNTDPETAQDFPFAADILFVADGGTGRFENATGEMLAHGLFTFPGPTETIDYVFEFDGTLSY